VSLIGAAVGSYKIVAELGKGGMGVVYVAEHSLIGKKAAVKVLLPRFAASADIVQRFFNEAKAAAAIQHPGIVEVFDFGHLADGSAYLVMELLGGESLTARLSRGPLPLAELVNVAKQTAAAVGAAHEKGIVHRDLKPDNVYLVPDEHMPFGVRVKVLDFGIAKLADEGQPGEVQTQAGEMLGTPNYMSPEQCKGAGDVDARADVYSLGCIVYEMATGTVPFDEKGTGAVIAAHIYEAPPPPRTIDANLAAGLEVVILRALAKEPGERPQSMDALAEELDRTLTAPAVTVAKPFEGVVEHVPLDTPLGKKPKNLIAIGGGLMAVVIGVAVALFSGGKKPPVVVVPDAAPVAVLPPDAGPPDAAPPGSDLASLTRRCDAGELPTCLSLGRAYEAGLGVELDLTRAFAVYLEACDKKLADACAATAAMYEDGKGVSTDTSRAVALYTRACDAGSGPACTGIARLTALGQGVPVDRSKAEGFFHKGCQAGDHVACLMGPASDAATQRLAAETPAACEAGQPRACYVLGLQQLAGQGGAGPSGIDLLRRSCELGFVAGCSEAAARLEARRGDATLIGTLAERACAAGDDLGCTVLGRQRLAAGDTDQALELFEKACQGGGEIGCLDLAALLDAAAEPDFPRATAMMRRACDGGSAAGCASLALRHASGEKARKDDRRAKLAADRACLLDASTCELLTPKPAADAGAIPTGDAGVTPVDAGSSP
jgi:TPR repeat protein